MKTYQDTENKIIGNLLKSPLKSKSLHQISIETKLSYVTVHKLIPYLVKKGLLNLEKKGKANLISIDFEHSPLFNLSSAMLYEKNKFLMKKPPFMIFLRELEESLADKFYTLILFGSYVNGNFTKTSDIDLLFIVPDRKYIEGYKDKINKILKLQNSIKLHINVIAVDDFMEMLNNKYTLGRSAFQNGMVLFGTEQYYAMVKKYVRKKGY